MEKNLKFKARLTILLVALLLSLACGSGTPSAPVTPTQASQLAASQLANPNSQFGIAGLIPRNFPDSFAADWINLYETLPETGDLLGTYTAWTDSPETAGQIPVVVSTVFALATRYQFTPLVALSFFRDDPDGGLEPLLSLSDVGDRAKFQQVAVAIAEKYTPPFLALGVEVNSYYERGPSDFDNFVSLYAETYDAIKAISPDTKVFTIFQYERLRGGQFFSGDDQNPAQWEVIDRFKSRLDLAAFTTYPFLLYASPADLPADYYTEIAKHTSLPVAFTEIGWPSEPLGPAPDSPYGGSQDEQVAFARRFFELTTGLKLSLALWSFPHDPSGEINPAFLSISLRHNDGTPKLALSVWQEMIKR